MDELLRYSTADPGGIAALREPRHIRDPNAAVALSLALAEINCSYEAAALLRPHRKIWKTDPRAPVGQAALDALTWWNKNWRDFARLKQTGKRTEAEALLGNRAGQYWDLPPLLMHLADFALEDGKLPLAEHLYRQVAYLAARGLPKMPMQAFTYAAQAGLIEVLLAQGKSGEALTRHSEITPNRGNAMAHEIQHVRLLAATGDDDGAMTAVAHMLITAENHRKGYGAEIRKDVAARTPELERLRTRSDWPAMVKDPGTYLKR